jgi:hypothetical protein
MGIDINEHDQVIAVFETFKKATNFCNENLMKQDTFFDLWIEKHSVS